MRRKWDIALKLPTDNTTTTLYLAFVHNAFILGGRRGTEQDMSVV